MKLTIDLKCGPDPFVAVTGTDLEMGAMLLDLAVAANVGDPHVARVSTKRWEIRDGLGNLAGEAKLEDDRVRDQPVGTERI